MMNIGFYVKQGEVTELTVRMQRKMKNFVVIVVVILLLTFLF